MAFEQLWSGDQEKIISFTIVFQYWVKKALVFIVFLIHGVKKSKKH